jgi:hypothetical protein
LWTCVTRGKASGRGISSSKGRAKPFRKVAFETECLQHEDRRGRLTIYLNLDGMTGIELNRERELGLDRRETG